MTFETRSDLKCHATGLNEVKLYLTPHGSNNQT